MGCWGKCPTFRQTPQIYIEVTDMTEAKDMTEFKWVPREDLDRVILEILHDESLKSAEELAWAIGWPESTVRDALTRLEARGAVLGVEMGALLRRRRRFFLQLGELPIRSMQDGPARSAGPQATLDGLVKQAVRLPMLEAFYHLAPRLCQASFVAPVAQGISFPGLGDTGVVDTWKIRNAKLIGLRWMSRGPVHAIAYYDVPGGPTLDVGLMWVGGQRSMTSLPKVVEGVHPRHTILICADRLTHVRLRPLVAASIFAADDNIPTFTSVVWDGQFLQDEVTPVFTYEKPVPDPTAPTTKTGIPENLGDNLRRLRMSCLLDVRSNRVLKWIEDWPGSNLTLVAEGCHMARSVAQGIVQALVKDGLVVELDRRLYLAGHGMSFVAVRDRVSHKTSRDRHAALVADDGRYCRQQQRHYLGVAKLAVMAGRHGRPAAPGFRWVVTLADPNLGNTQLKPDLWVLLRCPNGRKVWQPVEYELTARTDGGILRKLKPWAVAAEFGKYWPVLFVVADEQTRDKIASIGYNLGIPVAAATVEDFERGLKMGLTTDFRAWRGGEGRVSAAGWAQMVVQDWRREDLLDSLQPASFDVPDYQLPVHNPPRQYTLLQAREWWRRTTDTRDGGVNHRL